MADKKTTDADKPAAEDPEDPDTGKYNDRQSATEPVIAPDGHVVLSQEDIDNRDKS